jgi:hypothetical protein
VLWTPTGGGLKGWDIMQSTENARGVGCYVMIAKCVRKGGETTRETIFCGFLSVCYSFRGLLMYNFSFNLSLTGETALLTRT